MSPVPPATSTIVCACALPDPAPTSGPDPASVPGLVEVVVVGLGLEEAEEAGEAEEGEEGGSGVRLVCAGLMPGFSDRTK